MRNAIKIGLIFLAAAGIGAVIWLTLLYHDNDIKKVNINDSFFTAQVRSQIDKKIVNGKSFDAVMHSYKTLMQEVEDAAYIENIDNSEAANCKKMLAYGYAPKLTEHAKGCFANNVWNENHIDTLKQQAQNLIDANILPSDSHDLPKLNNIITTVNDYHSAVAATQVGTCATVAAAQNAISRANSFKRAPLTNCTSLVNALNEVPEKAKSSLVQSIVAACHRHSASTDALIDRINEYERTFGRNTQLSQEKSKLIEAKRKAEERRVHKKINESNRNNDYEDQEIE